MSETYEFYDYTETRNSIVIEKVLTANISEPEYVTVHFYCPIYESSRIFVTYSSALDSTDEALLQTIMADTNRVVCDDCGVDIDLSASGSNWEEILNSTTDEIIGYRHLACP